MFIYGKGTTVVTDKNIIWELNRFNSGCRIGTKIKPKQLAEKFGIGTSNVSDILKKKEEYEFLKKKIRKVNLLKTGSC